MALSGLLLTLGIVTVLWLWSLYLKDSSIVDIFWGFGFVILVWSYFFWSGNPTPRSFLFSALVTIWGSRLTIHLGLRNIGKGEDYRYQQFRQADGPKYWWTSYFKVFVLQGVIMWGISSFFPLIQQLPFGSWSLFDGIGVLLWSIGFFFEAVGDWQLTKFKSNPENNGKVLQTGLWKYTRHPNYFGDALLWWGFFFFVLNAKQGWYFIFAPAFMTFLLMRVSGVVLLEKKLKASKPEYADYEKRTAAFFPWPSRKDLT